MEKRTIKKLKCVNISLISELTEKELKCMLGEDCKIDNSTRLMTNVTAVVKFDLDACMSEVRYDGIVKSCSLLPRIMRPI